MGEINHLVSKELNRRARKGSQRKDLMKEYSTRKDELQILEDSKYLSENEISQKVIGAAIKIHKPLGPGLLESTYEACLIFELKNLGLNVEKQVALPVVYEGVKLDAGYRIDLLVEKKVIIELKSVNEVSDIYLAQILTYLKLSNCKLGILINFNELKVIDGIRRIVNKL